MAVTSSVVSLMLLPLALSASTGWQWRVVNEDSIGDHWVLSELTFFSDRECSTSLSSLVDTSQTGSNVYGGTIASVDYGGCLQNGNAGVLRDGSYNSRTGGCCSCYSSSSDQFGKWAGGDSSRDRSAGGTWVGYAYSTPVSVECVEMGTVTGGSQYVQRASLQVYEASSDSWTTVASLDFGAYGSGFEDTTRRTKRALPSWGEGYGSTASHDDAAQSALPPNANGASDSSACEGAVRAMPGDESEGSCQTGSGGLPVAAAAAIAVAAIFLVVGGLFRFVLVQNRQPGGGRPAASPQQELRAAAAGHQQQGLATATAFEISDMPTATAVPVMATAVPMVGGVPMGMSLGEPSLVEKAERIRAQLDLEAGTPLSKIIETACEQLGVREGNNLVERADACLRVLEPPVVVSAVIVE